ncbi:MAG TPA: hypothetical protein VFF54_08030 [Thermodesulfobacteriota bacterium]|nr:hypothetical protein [Thermodesulfobacteriota bacterium]
MTFLSEFFVNSLPYGRRVIHPSMKAADRKRLVHAHVAIFHVEVNVTGWKTFNEKHFDPI